jgi:CheY-like chemotaxis protein
MTNQSVDPLRERLRRSERASGSAIPAVAVSEYVRSEDRVQALLAGFKGYVSTPVNPQELAAVVATLTRKPPSSSSAWAARKRH